MYNLSITSVDREQRGFGAPASYNIAVWWDNPWSARPSWRNGAHRSAGWGGAITFQNHTKKGGITMLYEPAFCRAVQVDGQTKYVMVSGLTDQIVDDNNGCGYDTAEAAEELYGALTEDIEACHRQLAIEQWLDQNFDFRTELLIYACAGSATATLVENMLKKRGWVTQFAPEEIAEQAYRIVESAQDAIDPDALPVPPLRVSCRKTVINGEFRYVMVNDDTGEIILDDNKHGYRTDLRAWRAYNYIMNEAGKDSRRAWERMQIIRWLRDNEDVDRALLDENTSLKAADPTGHLTARIVRIMFKRLGIKTTFDERELLRVWDGVHIQL